jgi:hypothetical protein
MMTGHLQSLQREKDSGLSIARGISCISISKKQTLQRTDRRVYWRFSGILGDDSVHVELGIF